MAIIGGYDTVREIASDALGKVFAARKEGEAGEARYAVRVRRVIRRFDDVDHPASAGISAQAAAPDPGVRVFLDSVAAQKKLAETAGIAGHWAPIHASGLLPDGSGFAVTDLASLGSLQRLARGRVELDAAAIAQLLLGVIEGLKSAEVSGKRGHGNLKATNVLLCGGPELAGAKLILTDPVSDARADLERDRLRDLRGIGELIVLLVTYETKRAGWPVQATPAWARLGRSSGRWLDLVNRLLDPNDKAERPTLEGLSRTIAALAPPKSKHRPVFIGAAAAALVVLAFGAWWFGFRHQGPNLNTKIQNEFNKNKQACQTSWEAYCVDYNWFRQLLDSLNEPINKQSGLRAEVYAKNGLDVQALRDAMKVIQTDESEPYSIARVGKGATAQELKNQFPGNDRVICDDGVVLTRKGLDTLKSVRVLLKTGWPLAASLAANEKEFRETGWTAPADELHAMLVPLDPTPQSADVVTGIDETIAAAAKLQPLRQGLDALRNASQKLAGASDLVLATFGPSSKRIIADELSGAKPAPATGRALDVLGKAVSGAVELGQKVIAASAPGQVCLDDLHADPAYIALESRVKRGEVLSAPAFTDGWLKLADKYRPLTEPDPRAQWKAGEEIKTIRSLAAQLSARPVPMPLSPEEVSLLDRFDADTLTLARLSWCAPNRDNIEKSNADLRAGVRRLADAASTKKQSQDQRRAAGMPGVRLKLATPLGLGTGLKKTEAVCQSWRDAIAAALQPDNFDVREEEAAALEQAVRESLAGFTTAVPSPGAASDQNWSAALAAVVGAKVDDQVAAEFSKLKSPPAPAEVRSAAARATESQSNFANAVKAVEADLRVVERALSDGYLIADVAPEATAADAALSRVTTAQVYSDPSISQAARPLVDRAQKGRAIAGSSDTNELVALVATAAAAAPEQSIGAVARLAALSPAWPRTTDALKVCAALGTPARKAAATINDPARQTQVLATLDSGFAKLWTGFASNAATPQAMDAAIDSMKDFGVNEAQVDPRLRYNVMLRALRSEFAKGGMTDQAAVARLSDSASRLEGLGLSEARVGELSRKLRAISKDETPVFDPKGCGPGLAGWAASAVREDGPNEFVEYTKDGVRLEFVRVGEAGAPDTMYLGTTEVSVRMFAEMVAGGEAATLAGIMQLPDDSVACVWQLSGTTVRESRQWVKPIPQLESVFRADIKPVPPAPAYPMQSLSVRAAVYASALIRCRLPTADEWRRAYTAILQGRAPASALLRGAAFNQQREYIRTGAGQDVAAPWPDLNISYAQDLNRVNEKAEDGTSSSRVLLFQPVESGDGPIHNLVGNVAEMVFSDKKKFDDALARGQLRTKADVEKFVDDSWSGCAAIGGSSLSPSKVPVDKEYPIGSAGGDQDQGWSDLGFRLAFTATGKMPLDRQASDALAKAAYLLAPGGQ